MAAVATIVANRSTDREEIQKDGLALDDTYESESDNEWEGGAAWSAEADDGLSPFVYQECGLNPCVPADEVDIPDESNAYMDFLNSEAQSRGGGLPNNWADDDDELEEETLLETPLDLIEPYTLFRGALLGELPRNMIWLDVLFFCRNPTDYFG